VAFTEELCRELYAAGINKIDLTDHVAEASMNAIRILRKVTGSYYPERTHRAGKWGYSRDGIMHPNNWGGIIDWIPGDVQHPRYTCPWLDVGQVMIMSNGDVTRCCQDAFARGVIGTVFDEIDTIPYSTFVQCPKCHELVPDWLEQYHGPDQDNDPIFIPIKMGEEKK
jgi:hypothetical protein